MIPKNEKQDEKKNVVKPREPAEGKASLMGRTEAETDVRNGMGINKIERERRITLPGNAPQLRPNSLFCSHHQIHVAYPRPSTLTGPPSCFRPHTLSRGHPTVPFWICPTRLPNPHLGCSFHETQHPEWNQSAPVGYRKTRGGRTRAMSMNLDLELGRSEDRVMGWRAEMVEVIRVIEGPPGQHGCVEVPSRSTGGPGSIQQVDPLPCLTQEAPSLSSSSAWIDQGSTGSSTVVLRRSALDPRDKTRAWRRHTVVV